MNVYFLFLESIGTPELVLIAFVALIIFGPRKLPSVGRTIGKYTTEFKRASNEFRRSWEYEVEMTEREKRVASETISTPANNVEPVSTGNIPAIENAIGRTSARRTGRSEDSTVALDASNFLVSPEVRPIDYSDFVVSMASAQTGETKEEAETASPRNKREWL